jgi:hypothetical protein
MKLALPVILAFAITLCAGCGDDKSTDPARTVIVDSLVFTSPGGGGVAMGTTPLVCCGLYDPSFVNERAMRIVFYDEAGQKSGWQILVLIDHAQAGAVTVLPTVVVPPSKVPWVSMFVSGGELSSDSAGSSGTITVQSFHCDASHMHIRFVADATLASELAGGPTMEVHGTFEATFPATTCP